MKYLFFSFVFMFSLSAGAYFSDFSRVQRDLNNLKDKQECLERQNREQREYSECLERCRRQEETDRMLGMSSFGCFCSQPSSLGCY